MKYFIRPEHFDMIGKLMLMVSMIWAYFYFNDYLVPWFGGDKWGKIMQEFTEKGQLWWLWYVMLICNIAIPWLILWNKKWRRTPWLLAIIGFFINIGMWVERYVIIPEGLTINRMPFTWRIYIPHIEIYLTIGTISFFMLLYLLASRVIPLIPVWEVQEGQESHTLRQVGKAELSTLSEVD
jgi:molybdopterin-containing oxidoreductase family membrane subunit